MSLSKSKLVMVWRQVSDLENAREFSNNSFEYNVLGEDTFSRIYDAGGIMYGEWEQNIQAIGLLASECTGFILDQRNLVINPAMEVVHATSNFTSSMENVSGRNPTSMNLARSSMGTELKFLDESGNCSVFLKPSTRYLKTKTGSKFNTILGNRKLPVKANLLSRQNKTGIVALNLAITDIAEAKSFYVKTLGLEILKSTRNSLSFNVGNIILNLNAEPSIGLIEILKNNKRLDGDTLVFHTSDAKSTMERLKEKGVVFPKGLEESPFGVLANFRDPDGHLYSIWQPPKSFGNGQTINFHPTLKRILKE